MSTPSPVPATQRCCVPISRASDPTAAVSFFLEHDTGTEPLTKLIDKLHGYGELFDQLGRARPVLFWLHSSTRERHLRRLLTDAPLGALAVTGARDLATALDVSPAGPVWSAAGRSGPVRLVDLAVLVHDGAEVADLG